MTRVIAIFIFHYEYTEEYQCFNVCNASRNKKILTQNWLYYDKILELSINTGMEYFPEFVSILVCIASIM